MSRRRSIHARAAGFTLIEVLATVALLGIVLPVAMQGVSIATGIASTARHRSEAGSLAQSKLGELIATQQWSTGGALSGDFGEDWPEYKWEAQVGDWVAANQVNTYSTNSTTNPPRQLDVRVTWRGRTGEQFVQLSTLVYLTDLSAATSTTTEDPLP